MNIIERPECLEEKQILLVYFSGTGGVKRIASEFAKQLSAMEFPMDMHSLDQSELEKRKPGYLSTLKQTGIIILLFPVYAFNAPLPVFEWIDILPDNTSLPVAVISVSGGGEVTLNKSCRVRCINSLEKKLCKVFYERMMVMPSNWYIPTPAHLAYELIRAVPRKTTAILKDIISGKERRTNPGFFNTLAASCISGLEKWGTKRFGKNLGVGDSCTGCGWCVSHCPRENIRLIDGKPVFLDACIMCFRCIYGCREKAIYAAKGRFMVLKDGYDLEELEKQAAGAKSNMEKDEKKAKGALWQGVVAYLDEEE